ncbi:MAG: YgiT-type zinc finger protein [Syntrophobacteraceae bacterium]
MQSDTDFQWVKNAIQANDFYISEHVLRELLGGRTSYAQITSVLTLGKVIEIHSHPKRNTFYLALGSDNSKPVHVMFSGSEESGLTVLVVYKPKPPTWQNAYTRSPVKEGAMTSEQRNCLFCTGLLESIVVGNFDYRLEGKLYVLKDVPAALCTQCGEKYISAEASRKIEKLIAERQPEELETVTVLRYPAN